MSGFRFLLILFILFFSSTVAAKLNYIIDTDIGGDIDDVIALLVAVNDENKPLAITTSHIAPVEKAKIAKLILTETGHAAIPVYAGVGVTRQDPPANFLKLNSLWPPMYGYPNPLAGQKPWYEKQSLAYKEAYGAYFENMPIEAEFAPLFIARIAKEYSPTSPLIIVAIGPLHNIAMALQIDPSIKNNIVIYSMGGKYPKGYNWLISPEVTAQVLAQVKTICISSEFIAKNQLNISLDEFKQLNFTTKIGKSILADWNNWRQRNPNFDFTQLGDPVTLFLALHPEQISLASANKISFPCLTNNGQLKSEFAGRWYSMPGLENKLMRVANGQSHVQFVQEVISASYIKDSIIQRLNHNNFV